MAYDILSGLFRNILTHQSYTRLLLHNKYRGTTFSVIILLSAGETSCAVHLHPKSSYVTVYFPGNTIVYCLPFRAGNLTDCACDMKRPSKQAAADWKWGGCSDNVRYGMWFSAAFIDPPETLRHRQTRDVRALANLHNNEVGRKARTWSRG